MRKDIIKTSLFSLVVAAIALTAFLELKEFKEEEEVKEVRDRVVKINSSELSLVRLEPEGIDIYHDSGNWKLRAPIKDVIEDEIVDSWVSSLLSLDGRVLGSSKDKDLVWGDFGIFKDSRSILFKAENNDMVKVQISNKEAFDGSTYLRVRSKNQDVLISSDSKWRLETLKKPYDFRSKNLFNWSELSKEGRPTSFSVSNKSAKEYYDLNKTENKWTAKRRKKWGIDEEALKDYFELIKSQKVIAFVEPEKYKGKVELSFKISLSTGEKVSLEILKDRYTVYARASFRPDILLKINNKILKALYKPLLSLKSKEDFYFFKQNKVKSMLLKTGAKSFRVKNEDNVWVLKNKSELPKGKDFNGAKVFEMFNKLRALGGVRYVKANTLFYTSKKRITLYNSKNNMYYQLEVGQKFPTKFGSRRTDGYLLRSSSSSQLLVVEGKKLRDLFAIDYLQKAVSN